ncbi:hypothetical protein F4780DRAFT_573795 [Xylariomycetidae sp. FL0641]|nr:hypothetical protein F4780DRAFT_573795 [Xylariomycetidae sp. FL0641]
MTWHAWAVPKHRFCWFLLYVPGELQDTLNAAVLQSAGCSGVRRPGRGNEVRQGYHNAPRSPITRTVIRMSVQRLPISDTQPIGCFIQRQPR